MHALKCSWMLLTTTLSNNISGFRVELFCRLGHQRLYYELIQIILTKTSYLINNIYPCSSVHSTRTMVRPPRWLTCQHSYDCRRVDSGSSHLPDRTNYLASVSPILHVQTLHLMDHHAPTAPLWTRNTSDGKRKRAHAQLRQLLYIYNSIWSRF